MEDELDSQAESVIEEDAIEEKIVGGEISYENKFMTLGVIGAYTKYNGSLDRSLSIYNQFEFNQNENLL